MLKLSETEIAVGIAALPEWHIEDGELTHTLVCKDFVAALAVVNRIGVLAEASGHHPNIDIRYNRVRLALTTHDAGGLTSKDFSLAAEIDGL